MYVNGVRQENVQETFVTSVIYLSQFTLPYYGERTLREYLTLAALMRISGNASYIFQRVEQLISEECIRKGEIGREVTEKKGREQDKWRPKSGKLVGRKWTEPPRTGTEIGRSPKGEDQIPLHPYQK